MHSSPSRYQQIVLLHCGKLSLSVSRPSFGLFFLSLFASLSSSFCSASLSPTQSVFLQFTYFSVCTQSLTHSRVWSVCHSTLVAHKTLEFLHEDAMLLVLEERECYSRSLHRQDVKVIIFIEHLKLNYNWRIALYFLFCVTQSKHWATQSKHLFSPD